MMDSDGVEIGTLVDYHESQNREIIVNVKELTDKGIAYSLRQMKNRLELNLNYD